MMPSCMTSVQFIFMIPGIVSVNNKSRRIIDVVNVRQR